MRTRFFLPSHENLLFCRNILRRNGIVAVPTETIYALCADAFSEKAITKIFDIKRRSLEKPLICNISSFDMLKKLTSYSSFIFEKLTKTFWPGPLTIVVAKNPCVLDIVTAKKDMVAIRFSSGSILRQLTDMCGFPLVVPSANIGGQKNNKNAYEIYKDFKGKIGAILDKGCCVLDIESTIVSIHKEKVEILRYGVITKKMLQRVVEVF